MTSDTPDNAIAPFASSGQPHNGKPSILDNIRSRSIETLSTLVSTLFEQIDDTFFELADSAHNNNEQNVYFESMRDIRLQRKRVEHSFFASLELDFRNISVTAVDNTSNTLDDALELLDKEDVEIDVAISSMVSRARCEFPTLLLQINTRFSEFLKPISVQEDNNPLDPQQLVRHFVAACDHFQIGLQSRLIFLKQFDQLVLRHYEQVLLDTNQILIAAGILPNLRAIIRRTPSQIKQNNAKYAQKDKISQQQHANNNSASFGNNGNNAFGTLQSLLTATRNLQEPSVYIDSHLPSANQQEIFSFLDNIQDTATTTFSSAGDNSAIAALNVGLNLSNLLKQQKDNQRKINEVDTDIISIVDMIFEFILTQNLPPAMALLLGKLQIPVLKAAIKDKAFFNTNQHPARRLLNLIGHVCLGWDHNTTPETDKLYLQVEAVVSHILKNYSGDNAIFKDAEQQLLHHVKQEEHRSQAMEKRTIATEEGKAKTEQAKLLITQLVRDRIQGKELPPVVIAFLKTPWQKLLLRALLKEGKSSYVWRSTLQVADDLIWSVQPQKNEASHKRWLKIIPVLLGDIKTGLETIAYKPSDTDKMMSHLWKIHSQMLTHKGTDNPLRTIKVDLTDQQPAQPANAKIEARKAELKQTVINDLLHDVSSLKTGTWFNFIESDKKALRCKLTTKIRATDSYVFVNRFGAKTKQLTREELAFALHDKQVTVLNSGPIIDRALEVIITRLKSSLP
ncbi:hypothetical protein A9Q81_22930 [Gammaproteobacteria bacterium 42_54_T18]|nr:hypothetical protein A9Q81_22930 [Gammaproteobacteria bacterium 42_54_T18]